MSQANGNGSTRTNQRGGNQRAQPQPAASMIDRQPPFDLQAEIGVLGSVILNIEVLDDVAMLLKPLHFYDHAHEILFTHMLAMRDEGKKFDDTLLVSRLKQAKQFEEIGGASYLAKLVNAVPNAAHATYYAEIVRDKAIYRNIIWQSTILLADAYDEAHEPQVMLSQADAAFAGVSDKFIDSGNASTLNESVMRAMEALDDRIAGNVQGITTGIAALDHDKRLTKGDLVILAGRPSMGKCLGRGTPILMYDGTIRTVETIHAGDKLMGPDSFPRTVVSTTQGRAKMYSVHQMHGITYRTNGEHILSLVRSKTEKLQKAGTFKEISVAEVCSKPPSWLSRWRGYKVGVEYPAAQQPLDPYFVGLWLGDGASGSSRICSADSEIVDFLREYAERRGEQLQVTRKVGYNKAADYRITSNRFNEPMVKYWTIQSTLRRLNLLNNKHIPRCYAIASRAQRLQLLAGLVDSDGHYSTANNAFDITMTDRLLIEQIKSLGDSLGFRTGITHKKKRCQTGAVCDAWVLMIRGDISCVPIKVSRKKPKSKWGRNPNSNPTWSAIKITEEDGEDDYFGFQIDGDGLFLLEDGTVTHNSACATNIAVHAAKNNSGAVAFFSLEMSEIELADRMLCAEAKVDYRRMRNGSVGHQDRDELIEAAATLGNLKLIIDDKAGKTLVQIGAQCRRIKRKHGLALVIVDYLQLIEPDNPKDARQEQVAKISRRLKLLARELEVPILCLAQLNRQVESTKDSRPKLSHLRESGAIEQDADLVLFVHRPKFIKGEQTEHGAGEEAEIILAKGRNTQTKIMNMLWFGHWQRWDNPATPQQEASAPYNENSF